MSLNPIDSFSANSVLASSVHYIETMNRRRKLSKLNGNRDFLLFAFAGLVASFLFLTQFNLEEVVRFDRLQHLMVSGVLFFLFYALLMDFKGRIFYALSLAFMVGVGKELFDHQGQSFDVYANSVGLFVAVFLLFAAQAVLGSTNSARVRS